MGMKPHANIKEYEKWAEGGYGQEEKEYDPVDLLKVFRNEIRKSKVPKEDVAIAMNIKDHKQYRSRLAPGLVGQYFPIDIYDNVNNRKRKEASENLSEKLKEEGFQVENNLRESKALGDLVDLLLSEQGHKYQGNLEVPNKGTINRIILESAAEEMVKDGEIKHPIDGAEPHYRISAEKCQEGFKKRFKDIKGKRDDMIGIGERKRARDVAGAWHRGFLGLEKNGKGVTPDRIGDSFDEENYFYANKEFVEKVIES